MTVQISIGATKFSWHHRSWWRETDHEWIYLHDGYAGVAAGGLISFAGRDGKLCDPHGRWQLLAPNLFWLKFDARARENKLWGNPGFNMQAVPDAPDLGILGRWVTIKEQTGTETFMQWNCRVVITIGQNRNAITCSAAAMLAQGGRAPKDSTPEMGGGAPGESMDCTPAQGGRAPMDATPGMHDEDAMDIDIASAGGAGAPPASALANFPSEGATPDGEDGWMTV